MKKESNFTKKNKIYYMCTYAIFTALMCIFGPLSVPIGPIPISLTNLILYFAVYLLGGTGTLISYIVYLLLGLAGLPVFSGYQGGIGKLAGPTGGYLIGFILLVIISGITFKHTSGKVRIPAAIAAMVVGTAIAYLFGTVWFVTQMECTYSYAMDVCVIPFIPFDIAKIAIATVLGLAVRKPLIHQGLIAR